MTVETTGAVKRVLAATDRSASADAAARWAATLADGYRAELLLLQVLAPPSGDGTSPEAPPDPETAQALLDRFAHEIAGPRGRGKVVVDEDPAGAIVQAVEDDDVDVVVVGNIGMAGRKKFLLGNIPNRVSHAARCTVVIVNTAPAGAATLPPVVELSDATRGRRLARRAWRLGRIMVTAGARELMRRGQAQGEERLKEQARRFRDALDEAGPTFAKLGQILSTRPDLLAPAFIDELASLQERVTPLTEAEVVRAMEAAMGVPWEDVFATIEPEPLAAGTIAQVHRATLETGERVVVKVQRPTAEADILDDLGLLEMFAEKAKTRPGIQRVVDVAGIVDHLSRSLRRELDFRQEAANLRRMKEVLKPYSRLAVPEVYEDISGPRLLVMEEVQGVPVGQAPEGWERKEAARQFLESFYNQVVTEGFFHADPHPGNLKWWNGKIYLLDLGMVGQIEPSVREMVLMMMLAFAQEDSPFLSDIVLLLAGGEHSLGDIDLAAFRDEVRDLVGRYRKLSLREIRLGELLQEVTEIAFRHNVRMPANLMLATKAFAQMQLVAAELDPDLDPFSVAGSIILRNTLGQVTRTLNPANVIYEMQKTRVRLVKVLEAFETLIGARPGTPLQVNFRGTEGLEQTVTQAMRQASLAVGAGSAILGAAITANSERTPSWVPRALGGFAAVLSAGLLLELGRRRPSS